MISAPRIRPDAPAVCIDERVLPHGRIDSQIASLSPCCERSTVTAAPGCNSKSDFLCTGAPRGVHLLYTWRQRGRLDLSVVGAGVGAGVGVCVGIGVDVGVGAGVEDAVDAVTARGDQ